MRIPFHNQFQGFTGSILCNDNVLRPLTLEMQWGKFWYKVYTLTSYKKLNANRAESRLSWQYKKEKRAWDIKTKIVWPKIQYQDRLQHLTGCLLEAWQQWTSTHCCWAPKKPKSLIYKRWVVRGIGRVHMEILLLHSAIHHFLLGKKMQLFIMASTLGI